MDSGNPYLNFLGNPVRNAPMRPGRDIRLMPKIPATLGKYAILVYCGCSVATVYDVMKLWFRVYS